LGVVRVDCPRWRKQVKIRRCRDVRRRQCFDEAAQACGAVDDGAPDRHCLGEGVGEALPCARRIYENQSKNKKLSFFFLPRGGFVTVMTYPPRAEATDSRCMFGRRRLKLSGVTEIYRAGIAGKESCLRVEGLRLNTVGEKRDDDDTRPAPLHRTPLRVQNLTFSTQPPTSSPAWPCWPASSHIDL
jgi:hypothetical protein